MPSWMLTSLPSQCKGMDAVVQSVKTPWSWGCDGFIDSLAVNLLDAKEWLHYITFTDANTLVVGMQNTSQ